MAETQSSYIPGDVTSMARIELNIPRRSAMGNFFQQPNFYQQDLSLIQRLPIDQEFELRVSVLPSDKSIFTKNPVLFLFRETNRVHNNRSRFRYNGKKFVHPTHVVGGVTIQSNNRYRGGGHSNPYTNLDRVTEVPLNINTHSVTGAYEFYGGSDSNPDGTIFPFRPLARYSNSDKISGNGIRFPQPLYQPIVGFFDQGVGIETGMVEDSVGAGTFPFFPTAKGRKYKNTKITRYGIMLMIDNPDYQGPSDTQNPRKIVASNMVMFSATFKTANLIDPVASIVNKYAVDWRLNLL